MPNEIELKLRIATADIPQLKRHAAIRKHLIGKALTRRLVSTYYDTDDLQLMDRKVSLRVRRMSGGWFQAVKAAGHSLAGLHQRLEWEDIISKGEPDFTKITDPSLTPIFDDLKLRQALKPIFTTDMQRTEWQLDYEGSKIELSLDNGQLIAGKQQQPMVEIELELKDGQVAHLFALALQLQADIPLTIENVSKAQRGYAYYRSFQQQVAKAKSAQITADDSLNQALEKSGWECLRQLQANQGLALEGTEIEGVHQMRVALRRLKVVLRLFKLHDEEINADLNWLNTLLAKARDLDVMLTETLPQLKLPAAEAQQVQEHFQRSRKRAYQAVRQGLNSQRYQHLLLALGHKIASGIPHGNSPLSSQAGPALQKLHKRLLQRGKGLHKLASNEQHEARKSARHLRFALEFIAPALSGKRAAAKTEAMLEEIKTLQSLLGRLNDTATTAQTLALAARRTPALLPAAQLWQHDAARQLKRSKPKLKAAWKQFKQAKIAW